MEPLMILTINRNTNANALLIARASKLGISASSSLTTGASVAQITTVTEA